MIDRSHPSHRSTTSKLSWFIALYTGGILTVGVVAYGLRLWLRT